MTCIIVDETFGADVNIPKFRTLKELCNIDLWLFNNMSFIEGISGERFHYLVKLMFKSHNNRKNEKQYKFLFKRFQVFIALCYAIAGGRWGPKLKHSLGRKCRQIKNLHEGHEGEPSPLIEEFIFPDIEDTTPRIYPTRVSKLPDDFDDEIIRSNFCLRQQFIQTFGDVNLLNECHINQVKSFYLNDRYKSCQFTTNDEWNWVQVNNRNNIRRYARIKKVYEFVFKDPNNRTSTIKQIFWQGDMIAREETFHSTEEQFNDYTDKSFDCLDKVNVMIKDLKEVWLPLEAIDSAVILLHDCCATVPEAKSQQNYIEMIRNLIRHAVLNQADPSTMPCGVKSFCVFYFLLSCFCVFGFILFCVCFCVCLVLQYVPICQKHNRSNCMKCLRKGSSETYYKDAWKCNRIGYQNAFYYVWDYRNGYAPGLFNTYSHTLRNLQKTMPV